MWQGPKFWNWLGHTVVWVGLYILFSPIPVNVGGIELIPYSAEAVSAILLYSFLVNAILFYSYAYYWFPRYLVKPTIGLFWSVNLVYLLFGTLAKSLLDGVYSGLMGEAIIKGGAPLSLGGWILLNLMGTALVLLVVNAFCFIQDWWQNRRARKQLENEKLKMELAALKHQINPHFLFNILNGLYALALKNDDDPTANGIHKLSEMMRYVLYESNDEKVRLEQEISYIQNYIDLQRLRVSKQVSIHFEIKGEIEGLQIAPMLFIPFIENAFKFGISTVQPTDIHIRFHVQEGILDFSVQNHIHQVQVLDHAGYKGIGLDNVRKRLQLLYPDRYQLRFEEEESQFKVKLRLEL